MQPFSGNQRPDLRTSLMNMSLVLRLARKMHVCRSSSNAARLPTFLKRLQNIYVLFTLDKVHKSWRMPLETTSERPKLVQTRQFLTLLSLKCALRHDAVHFFNSSTSKSGVRESCFFTFDFHMCFVPQRRTLFQHFIFQKCSEICVFCTSKCASRHNDVHFPTSQLLKML